MADDEYDLGLEGLWFSIEKGAENVMTLRLIEALRSGKLQQYHLIELAEMLEAKGRTTFRLKVFRRPGNRNQRTDVQDERRERFQDIYIKAKFDGKEAIQQAQLPLAEGGLNISEPTARKYLSERISLDAAEAEAWELPVNLRPWPTKPK